MSSYSIVLAPLGVILATDFFLIKKQKLNIYELYQPRGIYHYSGGWNWRAFVALACAVGPLMPGMVNAINPAINIGNASYLYLVSNIVANTVAFCVYLGLNWLYPAPRAIVAVAVHDLVSPEDGYALGYGNTAGYEEDDKKVDSQVKVEPVA